MSNAKNVAKLVEQAVRNELRNSPGFAGLSKGFEQSVLELVKRGVQEGFKKVLFLTWCQCAHTIWLADICFSLLSN